MKVKNQILFLSVSFLMLCSFSNDVGYYGTYGSTPVLMKRAAFESAIKTLPIKELDNTTRINLYRDMIYIVELYKGVHVIDNTNPVDPQQIYFINIPGCVDMSIKGDQLFARSAEDLVAVDISDLSNVQEIKNARVRETFPELANNNGEDYMPSRFSKEERPDSTVIVAWIDNE